MLYAALFKNVSFKIISVIDLKLKNNHVVDKTTITRLQDQSVIQHRKSTILLSILPALPPKMMKIIKQDLLMMMMVRPVLMTIVIMIM